MRTTLHNSVTTKSTHFKQGSLSREICFLTMASNAMSGVKRPTLIPAVKDDLRICALKIKVCVQTMDVSDCECNLSSEFFLVNLHFDYLKWETLVEQPIDFGTTTELQGVHEGRAWAFNCPLKVRLQLLDHPVNQLSLIFRRNFDKAKCKQQLTCTCY